MYLLEVVTISKQSKQFKIFNLSPFIWSMGNKKGIPSIYNIQKEFVNAGHEVHFLIPDNNIIDNFDEEFHIHKFWVPSTIFKWLSKSEEYSKQKLRMLSTFIGIVNILTIYSIYYSIGFAKCLYLVRKIRPDVIYGHVFFFIPLAYLIGKIYRIPTVCRVYGIGSYPFVLENNRLQMLLHLPELIAFKIPVDLMIITNDGTKGDVVAKKLCSPAKKLVFWVNGVNKNMYQPDFDKLQFKRKLGISPKDFMVLTVSRLEKWKHVDRIIKAMPLICSKNKNIKCIIVGEGPQKKELEMLSKQLNVDSNVMFTGSVSHTEVQKFMNASDIFVSLYDLSNVANPVLEAMTCGKPIVTLDVGGTSTIIENLKNGILVKMEHLDEIPKIIDNLINDEKKCICLGNNAREFVIKNFQTWHERGNMEVVEVENLINRTY